MKVGFTLLLLAGIASPVAAQREDLVTSYAMRDPMAFARRLYAHASAPELERALDERREADALAIAVLWAHEDLDAWLDAHRTALSEGAAAPRPSECDSPGPHSPSLGCAEPAPLRGARAVQQFFLYSPALLAGENPVAPREHLDWALSAGAPANACGFANGTDPAIGEVLARVAVRTTDDGCAYALDRGIRRALADGTDVERAPEAIDALVRSFADHPATLAAFMRFLGARDFFAARANLGTTARDAWVAAISDRAIQNSRGDTKVGIAALVAIASLGPDNAGTDAALTRLRGIDRRGTWSRAVHVRALEHHVRTRLASTPVVVDGTTQRRIAEAEHGDRPGGWMVKLLELWIGRTEDPTPWITHANGRLVAAPALVFMLDAAYRRGDLDAASRLATTVSSFRGPEARAWAHWYLAAIAARRREHETTANELLAALRYAARLPERTNGVRAMLEHHAIPRLAPWLSGHGRCAEAIELWRRWPVPPGCGLGMDIASERRVAGLRACGANP